MRDFIFWSTGGGDLSMSVGLFMQNFMHMSVVTLKSLFKTGINSTHNA